jgi:AcrR family transcriptional regulator
MSASADPAAIAQSHRPAGPATPPRPGLRERKKAKTRAAIRDQALRLIKKQGYDATTVEQIAEAAEVSPSTFFRYFPTKEDVVLQDDMELRWVDALRAQPPGVGTITAIRASLGQAFANISDEDMAALRETMNLALSIPAVRARMLDEFSRTSQVLAAAIGERAGRSPEDFEVVTAAGAVLGVAMAAWFGAAENIENFAERFERGLALLEAGLPL